MDHGAELTRNEQIWALVNRAHTDAAAEAQWRADGIRWGLYRIPESQIGALPPLAGADVVELGAGTAFLAAAIARAGASVVAVDLSIEQLRTAARCQASIGPGFPLVQADGGAVPLRDACADLVVSEHGASVWCDPADWLPEAARLLRPGGRLVFLANSVLSTLCVPDDEGPADQRLHRAQKGLYRTEWDGGGIEFHPSHSVWIALLRRAGFTIEAMHELYAPDDADDPEYYEIADALWGRRWPVEDLWVARLDGDASSRMPG